MACIFLAIVPLSFFVNVARLTRKYCYEDWVVEKMANDRDGKRKKKPYFKDVPPKTDGVDTPGRRHRANEEAKKYKITPGYVMVWIANSSSKVHILVHTNVKHARCGGSRRTDCLFRMCRML